MQRLGKYAIGRQEGSGRPETATTYKSEESVEDLVCPQEDNLWTHIYPRDIARELNISHSPVRKVIKTKGIKQFRRIKTYYINETTR